MPGGPTTTQNSNSQSSPWQPAVQPLQGLLGQISGLNTGVTGNQSQAVNSLWSGANGVPSFAPQASNSAGNLFAGGGANNQAGTVQGAYGNLQGSLGGLANPANLNPYSTPGFSQAMSTMNNDISNSVNDRFAAAGRDLSPGNSTALARGLSQGEGGLLQSQYNANAGNLTGAANSLFGAGLGTGNALSGYNQAANSNQLAGAGLAGQIPGLAMAPGQAQLSAANMGQMLPGQNLAQIQSLLTPIAALGGQSSGTQTTQSQTPMWQQLAGLGITAAGMAMGNPGSYLSAGSSLMGALGGNPGGQNSSYMPGGMYSGGQPSFQNGQYNPMFADGGRPPVGQPAIVGERGPEVFVPDQPGTVVPNGLWQNLMRFLPGQSLGGPATTTGAQYNSGRN